MAGSIASGSNMSRNWLSLGAPAGAPRGPPSLVTRPLEAPPGSTTASARTQRAGRRRPVRSCGGPGDPEGGGGLGLRRRSPTRRICIASRPDIQRWRSFRGLKSAASHASAVTGQRLACGRTAGGSTRRTVTCRRFTWRAWCALGSRLLPRPSASALQRRERLCGLPTDQHAGRGDPIASGPGSSGEPQDGDHSVRPRSEYDNERCHRCNLVYTVFTDNDNVLWRTS
jgi:hypothetical protein